MDNVGICHQIALYCASNSGKTLKVLGKHLHKLRQRAKIFRAEAMRALRVTSMHSLHDGENIYSRRENVIFMEQVKIAQHSCEAILQDSWRDAVYCFTYALIINCNLLC